MVGRVPIRIYKLKKSKQSTTGLQSVVDIPPPIPASKYLQYVTDVDIDSSLNIILAQDNIPGYVGPDFVGGFGVTFDSVQRPYTTVNAQNWYIRQTGKTASTTNALPDVFEFYVNPQHVTPSYKKLITEIRTRGGYEIQHWGEALTEVKVAGISGGMHRDVSRSKNPGSIGQTLTNVEDVTESTAWKRLSQLKQLYDADHSTKNQEATTLLGMNYFDKYYVGYFVDFQGPEADKDQPYLVNYSFSFKVQQELSMQLAVGGGLAL